MDKQNQADTQSHPSSTASQASVTEMEDKERTTSLHTGKNSQRHQGSKGSLYLSERVEERTRRIINSIGYGLLIFGLFDYLHIVIPPQFTNSMWEFQTIGALVEHVAIPLLGLAMIFYRPQGFIGQWERRFLMCLSWFSLLLGLLYLLMLPLGVTDTWRLYRANEAQIAAQVSQKNQPLQQLASKLNQAKTDEQLKQILASLSPENRIAQIKQPQQIKDKLLAQISQTQRNLKQQANAAGTTQRKALLKNSLKWNLGALVAGVLFIWIWWLTSWARMREY